jgi:hypothetical protein
MYCYQPQFSRGETYVLELALHLAAETACLDEQVETDTRLLVVRASLGLALSGSLRFGLLLLSFAPALLFALLLLLLVLLLAFLLALALIVFSLLRNNLRTERLLHLQHVVPHRPRQALEAETFAEEPADAVDVAVEEADC